MLKKTALFLRNGFPYPSPLLSFSCSSSFPPFFLLLLQVNLSDLNHELGKAKESLVFESGKTLAHSFFLFLPPYFPVLSFFSPSLVSLLPCFSLSFCLSRCEGAAMGSFREAASQGKSLIRCSFYFAKENIIKRNK